MFPFAPRALVGALVLSAIAPLCAATPLFKIRSVLGDASTPSIQYEITGFNKQGFAVGAKNAAEMFFFKDGVYTPLSSESLEPGSSMNVYDISDADAQGVMRIGGRILYPSGYSPNGTVINSRGLMVTVTTNGAITGMVALPNYIIPPDSLSHPNEESISGLANGINASGVAGGYPAQLWTSTANATRIGNCGEIGDIDNEGHYVMRGVEFFHFQPENYYGEAIGPSVLAVPGLPGEPNGANVHLAQINNNRGAGVDYDANTFQARPVVWTFDDSHVQQLPTPAGYPLKYAYATSINASGDVVGWGQFTNGPFSTLQAYLLWKNRGDHYDPYLLKDLLVDGYLGDDYTHIFINDVGQIALDEAGNTKLMILDPVGAKIIMDASANYPENTGSASVKLKLERAEGYTGPVSVHYSTADYSAVAGVRYTAVNGTVNWPSFDSSDKVISVPLVNDNVGNQYDMFMVNLDNFVNAAGLTTNQYALIQDDCGTFTWTSAAYKIADNWTNVTVTMQRLGGTDGAATIAYGTYDETAVGGTDYIATNGTLSWAAGDATPRSITIPIISRGAGFSNVTFGISSYVSTADSAWAAVGEPYYPEVTIVRPGHPLPSAVTQFSKTNSNTLQFSLDATIGGKLLIQSSTNLIDPNSWQTVLTLTNVTGSVNINDFVVNVKGKFYRVISQ